MSREGMQRLERPYTMCYYVVGRNSLCPIRLPNSTLQCSKTFSLLRHVKNWLKAPMGGYALVRTRNGASLSLCWRISFPLIKLEAQKDRMAARQVRQGKRIRVGSTKFPPVN